MSHRIGIAATAGYGVGDFAFNLFFTGLNLYLLFYYTDVLGIAPAVAGVIFMLAVIWDAVTDPVMGWIATRTRTRFGKYRPYIIFGAPVMAISFVMMFAAPVLFPGAIILASALAHIVFRTLYTIVSIPYTSLSAAMTNDSKSRSSLAGARMIAAILGGLFTAISTPALAAHFGGDDLRFGYIMVSVIYGVIATIILTGVFFVTRENMDTSVRHRHLTTPETMHFLQKNGAFWVLFAAIFVGGIASSIGSKSLVYYVGYYVGAPEAVGAVLGTQLLFAALGVPVWMTLARRFPKRNVWLGAAIGGIAIQGFIYMTAPTSAEHLIALQRVAGLFVGAIPVMFWAMVPDTVEFGEWHSRIRDEGIVFGLSQFALKAGSGIGVGCLGLALGVIGYVDNQVQTAEALEGIRVLSFLVPVCGLAATAAIIAFYPISGDLHARLVRGIDRRKVRYSPAELGVGQPLQ